MARYGRNTVILAKTETTPGTDALPVGGTDAVLVSDFNITPLDAQQINRNVVRGYFGGSEQLVGPASIKLSFTVELAGSGTAATAPAWGTLMKACAAGEGLLSTPARVEYTPVSSNLKTATIYYYDDGVVHKLVNAMGNCTLSAKVGEKPVLKFEFIGVNGGIAAASPATPVYTAWQKPVAMTKANVVDITLGATYAAGALSGGTVYPSTGIELNLGNSVNFTALLSSETVDITDRESTGSVEFDLTAAQEVTFMGSVTANTTQSLGFTIGTAAGNKIILHAPAVQLIEPKKVDLNGRRLIGYGARFVPSSGNDEWRIVTQ